jgi:tRNA(Ile)-lysidine synthase
LVVAFSGGGDSLFLMLTVKAWADQAGRRLIAVTLDHRLQAAGAEWARWCGERAGRLGVEHHTLVWQDPKPRTGLPAVARTARHGLIAEFARSVGAIVILMGHTADDGLEARLMRASGGSTTPPREWSPSPIWPQGRGIFVLRPLVRLRRSDIRAALTVRGEPWIDDPFNLDPFSARARARAELREAPAAGDDIAAQGAAVGEQLMLDAILEDKAGALRIPRQARGGATQRAAPRFLGAAVLSASGAARPPRSDRLLRLAAALDGHASVVATLGGERIVADAGCIILTREPGDMSRRSTALSFALGVGDAIAWDGRFEIEARVSGLSVRPLAGLASRLSPAERNRLGRYTPAARRALPAIVDDRDRLTCPVLARDPRVATRPLVFARLAGACGGLHDEAALGRMAEAVTAS